MAWPPLLFEFLFFVHCKNFQLLTDNSRQIWGECKLYSLCLMQIASMDWFLFFIFLRHRYRKRSKKKITIKKFISEWFLSIPHQLTCFLLAVVDLLMQESRAGLGFCPIKLSARDLTHLLSKIPPSRAALTGLHVHPWRQTGWLVSPKLFLFISSISLPH